MTHQELRDLLPAYALDVLTSEETREVEAHLRDCPECQAELRALGQVAADLGAGIAAIAPPEALRRQVMDAVRPARARAAPPRRWGLVLGAAAAALFFALAGLGIAFNQRLAALQDRLTVQEQALALLASPSAKTVVLAGSLRASVRLVYDAPRGQGALVVADLQDPGTDRVYQLWLIAGPQPESAGVFRPAPGRPVIIPLSADFPRYKAVAISVEPAPRGSPQPTTTPILIGTI